MINKIRRFLIAVTATTIILTSVTPVFALSQKQYTNFSNSEREYEKACKNYKPEDSDMCEDFADYKKEKISRGDMEIDSANRTLAEIKGRITSEEEKLAEYNSEAEKLNSEVKENTKLIEKLDKSIATVEENIKEREVHIAKMDDQVKAFLVNMQGEMRVNGYIEFLMGASSFADIIRRTEGMKRIKQYNQELISEVLAEKKLLEIDKSELQESKITLEAKSEESKDKIKQIELLYEAVDKKVENLRKEQRVQEELIEETTNISKESQASIENIFKKIGAPTYTPSLDFEDVSGVAADGWVYPVEGNFRVGEGVWGYGDGDRHLGQDFPAPMGSTLVAPAPGVILDTKGGCSDNYDINDTCNGGWGNYLTMAVNVNGGYYGLLYAHIQNGGHFTSSGNQIQAGQAIARMGSSGKSSGPHLHVEVYYLGHKQEDIFNFYTTNTFGNGGSDSERPNSRCHENGNTAPCRINPRAMFP